MGFARRWPTPLPHVHAEPQTSTSEDRSVSLYGLARALPWLLIDVAVLTVVAVPIYFAFQVALAFVGVNP